jgi:hypothetical protein
MSGRIMAVASRRDRYSRRLTIHRIVTGLRSPQLPLGHKHLLADRLFFAFQSGDELVDLP